jgi:hypothetical protein
VVGFTSGSRGKVAGKTCEKRTEEEIIIIIIIIIINWAQDRDRLRALVKTVMNLRVP